MCNRMILIVILLVSATVLACREETPSPTPAKPWVSWSCSDGTTGQVCWDCRLIERQEQTDGSVYIRVRYADYSEASSVLRAGCDVKQR